MTKRAVRIGDVLLVKLPQQQPPGSEQTGTRPAVVVGLPQRLGTQRFPLWIVVPMTSRISGWTRAAPNLYPTYPRGVGGLSVPSAALLDHLRGVDITRVVRFLGSLSPAEYAPIQAGLREMTRVTID